MGQESERTRDQDGTRETEVGAREERSLVSEDWSEGGGETKPVLYIHVVPIHKSEMSRQKRWRPIESVRECLRSHSERSMRRFFSLERFIDPRTSEDQREGCIGGSTPLLHSLSFLSFTDLVDALFLDRVAPELLRRRLHDDLMITSVRPSQAQPSSKTFFFVGLSDAHFIQHSSSSHQLLWSNKGMWVLDWKGFSTWTSLHASRRSFCETRRNPGLPFLSTSPSASPPPPRQANQPHLDSLDTRHTVLHHELHTSTRFQRKRDCRENIQGHESKRISIEDLRSRLFDHPG